MRIIKGFRFVTDILRSEHGSTRWQIGRWQKLKNERPLRLCVNGFHASQKPIDSLSYVFGSRWFECEARGHIFRDTDKFCAAEMRLVKEIPQRVIRQFGIDCAWHVLHIFEDKYPNDKRPREAIEAARALLKFPTQENRDRLAAARTAAWKATEAVARTATWAGAEPTARFAAWGGAETGARAGAWKAAEAGTEAEAAARAATSAATWTLAWGGAEPAAWAGTWRGARAAAWAATWTAERKWQNRHLLNLIRKERNGNNDLS